MAHQSSPKYSEAESSASRSGTSQTASGAFAYFAANTKPVSEYKSPYAQPTNKGAQLQSRAISQPQGASSSTAYTVLNSNLREASLEEENTRFASGSAYSTSSQSSSIYSSASGNMSSAQKISPVSGTACVSVLLFYFLILSFFFWFSWYGGFVVLTNFCPAASCHLLTSTLLIERKSSTHPFSANA